jgi:soluble lytic murein transglycosylase
VKLGLTGLLALLFPLFILPAAAGELSASDHRLYAEAFAAAERGDWARAERLAGEAKDRLPAAALRWLDLTGGATGAGFATITDFIANHPDWPRQKQLIAHAEDAAAGASDADVARWFQNHPPVTTAGKLRQAEIWLAAGRESAGTALLREVWIEGSFSAFEEKSFLQRYRDRLSAADHVARLDRLLWDGETQEARRMLRLVDADTEALAEARIALADQSPGAERLLARVPAKLQSDPGLLFERLRWRRREQLYDGAVEILKNAPKELGRPMAWANERQALARRVLANGDPALAYALAANHGLEPSGQTFADLEFLAGWIALRALHRNGQAYDHFVRLHDSVKLPISMSRGAYWAARAADALGYQQLATAWYEAASEHGTTYYGQIAAAHLGAGMTPASVVEPVPTAQERAAFDKRDLVRLARILYDVGADEHVRPFLHAIADTVKTPAEFVLAARLAIALDHPDLAIVTTKRASTFGITLIDEGYPMARLPPGNGPEGPLLLAMTRQESAFDHAAVSAVGARGMMQLMPATAKRVAKSLKLPFSLKRLTADARYNMTLGRAYLEGLIEDFGGSYVLAIAAYNAGPGRVRDWMGAFGDPRSHGADIIDWVESIPFSETRNYVQRVLENLQVYRLRVGDRGRAFSLAADLKR